MIEQDQKKRAVYLDNFPSGFLIIGGIAAVFILSLMSGVKVIGVDQEKVAIKKDRLILDKDRADFYRKKKEWDGVEERLMVGRAELESLQRQRTDEAGKKDALQKENKGLDETRQGLKNDVAILEKQKEVIGKTVTEIERMLDGFQRKLDEVKSAHGGLVQENQDLMEKNTGLEERNKGLEAQLGSLKQEIADNDGRLKNAIRDLVSYVEKMGVTSDDFGRKKQEFDIISGAIQDNTSKLFNLSEDIGAVLKDFTAKTNDLKASKTNVNISIDELTTKTKDLSSVTDRMSSLRQELINATEKMDKAAGSVKKEESRSEDIRKILDKLDNLSSQINAIQKNNAETKGN